MEFITSYFYIYAVYALQPKATGTPAVKLVESITHCSKVEHTPWEAVRCLSKRMLAKTYSGILTLIILGRV